MRLIGAIDDDRKGILFSQFLEKKGIHHQIEILTDRDWGSHDYGTTKCNIWISDEDQVDEAMQWLDFFKQNPDDPIFIQASKVELPPLPPQVTSKAQSGQQKKQSLWDLQSMGPITRFLLIGCCLLFFIAQFITPVTDAPANFPATPLFSSPIEKEILFDYPHTYDLVDRLIKLYGFEAIQDPNDLPVEGKALIEKINHTPFWQGIYSIVLKDGFKSIPEKMKTTPMFEKIHDGQVWRLVSPIVFHADLFHLFFNMLWLMVLGKQIEQRLSPVRYLSFILIVAIFSNTSQYLMSGPNFIGFSGVLCGMLTFIWMRQKYAAWEGYQLDKTTIAMMLIFILAMAAIQFFSFFLEKVSDITISPGIANMAHLSGAFLGVILGRLNFFRWRTA